MTSETLSYLEERREVLKEELARIGQAIRGYKGVTTPSTPPNGSVHRRGKGKNAHLELGTAQASPEAVLDYLRLHGPSTMKAIRKSEGFTIDSMRRATGKLEADGLVTRARLGKGYELSATRKAEER